MAYTTQYDLAGDTTFLKRVTMAMLDYAHDVFTEATSVTSHEIRAEYARRVALRPNEYALSTSETICSFTTLSAGSTDQNIKDAVASIWNLMAGA
jgi:hypothetical protein